jgi:HEAT repeat protein
LAPDVVVPALNKALCNPNPAQRIAAARALSFFGEPAIPVLRAALEDPSPEVHDMITNAIYGIESAVH